MTDRPILEPGRPGDLLLILREAKRGLDEIQARDDSDMDAVHGIAIATLHALCAWLGIIDVPEVPDVH